MKKQKIEIALEVFETISELPIDIQKLMDKAQKACENAYAPYSHFRVGAAILMASGEITIGNNQENAAYPSGLCAERVAIFHTGALFPNERIVAMAITARTPNQTLTEPSALVVPADNLWQNMSKNKNRLLLFILWAKPGK